mmetsp:Transcript_69576/g.213318  ORF Transcript_69576/g.213318 Transcript_69576/m.213318 type:complete len:229 (+) Transcript_69576:245-931(+)
MQIRPPPRLSPPTALERVYCCNIARATFTIQTCRSGLPGCYPTRGRSSSSRSSASQRRVPCLGTSITASWIGGLSSKCSTMASASATDWRRATQRSWPRPLAPAPRASTSTSCPSTGIGMLSTDAFGSARTPTTGRRPRAVSSTSCTRTWTKASTSTRFAGGIRCSARRTSSFSRLRSGPKTPWACTRSSLISQATRPSAPMASAASRSSTLPCRCSTMTAISSRYPR